MTEKEQKICDRSGGGEKGARAVVAYREYMQLQRDIERENAKERCRNRYVPRNEKSTVTLTSVEDDYD